MKNLLIALICFVSSNLIFAENTKNFPFLFDYQNKSNIKLTELSFDLNKKYSEHVFNSSAENLVIASFPVSLDKFGTVKLKQMSPVFDVNTDWITVKNINTESFTPPVILTYEGTIEDEPDSRIILTYSNGCLFGSIQRSDGSIFSILPDLYTEEIVQKHYFSMGVLTAGKSPYLCFTAEPHIDIPDSYQQQSKSYETQLAPSKLLEVKIACEATSEFYDLFANLDKATAYIVSVIANTSKIYEENLNVRMKISYFLIWQNSTVDPYRSGNLLSDKLWLMPTLWENKPVDRAITVLFASLAAQQGGVSVAGIAMGGQPGRGNLCSKDDGYCVLGIKGGVQFSRS